MAETNALDRTIDRVEAERDEALAEVERLRGERAEILAVLDDMRDPDPCCYDHNNLCQAHSLHERPCPHETARRLLAESLPGAQTPDTEVRGE